MLTIRLEGMDRLKAKMLGIEKQANFANVVAINRAAFAAREAIQKEMGKVFDRPTPWVLGSVRVTKATLKAKTVGGIRIGGANVGVATVDLDHWGNKQGVTVDQVLSAQISGGQRRNKRHEKALQLAGILPAGMGIAPGPSAKLDQYGNMTGGQIVQILSWFQAAGAAGYSKNMKDGGKRLGRDNKRTGAKGFAYFAIQKQHGRLHTGIYQRFAFGFGSAVKAIMYFVPLPNYTKRLDFYGIGDRVARAEFKAQYPLALKQALATAR